MAQLACDYKSLVGDSDGSPNLIEGTARVVDEGINAKLAVTFQRPDLEEIEFRIGLSNLMKIINEQLLPMIQGLFSTF